jgi:transposase InsO family protein
MLRADYPLTVICQVLNLPRSTLYYAAQPPSETAERQAISAVVEQFPTYGSRRVTAQLRRVPYQLVVNRKRARRIIRELGLLRRHRRRTRRTTNSQHRFGRFPNLVTERVATAPDEIWISDIPYIRLGDAFIYLAIILDVYTRDIRGWHLSRTLAQALTMSALRQALERARPQIHHSDQGIQYAAPHYVQLLRAAGVQISMAAVGEPTQNGYAERVIRTIKEQEVALTE